MKIEILQNSADFGLLFFLQHKTSGCLDDPGPGWSLVPGSKVISETKQSNNSTHETKEEKTDTEITEEIGGLTREVGLFHERKSRFVVMELLTWRQGSVLTRTVIKI